MEREEEIKHILKHLLSEIEKTIDGKQYSSNISRVLNASNGVMELSKKIEKYLKELEDLKQIK